MDKLAQAMKKHKMRSILTLYEVKRSLTFYQKLKETKKNKRINKFQGHFCSIFG